MKNIQTGLLILALIFSGCIGIVDPIERGLFEKNGMSVIPAYTLGVRAEPDFDQNVVTEAIEFWHVETGREDLFEMRQAARVVISVGELSMNSMGRAQYSVDYYTGILYHCDIKIHPSAVTGEKQIFLSKIIRHELGHCLALKDDTGTGYIMSGNSSETDAGVSPNDIDLIQSY